MYNEAFIENIPLELRELKQWAVFKSYPDNDTGKHKKTIISPVDSRFAKSDSPETWEDFNSARYYCRQNNYHGLVFALTEGVVFIDLDNAVNGISGEIVSPEAKRLLELLPDSYAEQSVSGRGLHILCKGNLPEDAKRRNDEKGIEMYDNRRFICMTGNIIDGRYELKDYSDKIADIAYEFMGRRLPKPEYNNLATASPIKTDSDLVEDILKSKQSAKFNLLYSGDTASYPSHSNADAAFVYILAWWTQDPAQIDRIYRASGLMRGKWDSLRGNTTYGNNLITQALAHVSPRKYREPSAKDNAM